MTGVGVDEGAVGDDTEGVGWSVDVVAGDSQPGPGNSGGASIVEVGDDSTLESLEVTCEVGGVETVEEVVTLPAVVAIENVATAVVWLHIPCSC